MNNFTPKYIIIQDYIIDKINKCEYAIGDKIPSENELSTMFNVSRITSNKAVSDLELMGIVERVRGKGTFIKSNNINSNDFSHILSKSFKISSEASESHAHKIEKIEKIESNDYIANRLNTKKDEFLYKITRIIISNDEAIGIDYSYIPLSLVKGNTIDESNLSNTTIHDYLKKHFDIIPKYLHVHIDAKFPDKHEKKLLKVAPNTPVIIWETNIIDYNDKIIAFTATIARSDKYRPFINFEL